MKVKEIKKACQYIVDNEQGDILSWYAQDILERIEAWPVRHINLKQLKGFYESPDNQEMVERIFKKALDFQEGRK